MKAYTYKPEELGFKEFPSGTLRLDDFEKTENPNEADVFIIPPSLMHIKEEGLLKRAPYMAGREERHVAFDVSDFEYLFNSKCILIRCNLRPWMRDKDPNSISWAWPVEDFSECIELPSGGFKFDVSFQGWYKSHVTRELAMNSCLQNPNLKNDIAGYKDFTGYIYYTDEGIRRRKEFRRSMKESRIALCPQSINGVFPYRFFEAMSAGRVAALFSDDYIFPWMEEIPWDEVCFRFSAKEAPNAGNVLHEVLKRTPDEKLIEMGKKARQCWERYLDNRKWPQTMSEAVLKKFRQLGLPCA